MNATDATRDRYREVGQEAPAEILAFAAAIDHISRRQSARSEWLDQNRDAIRAEAAARRAARAAARGQF